MDFEDETASEARTRALEALCEPGKGSSCSRGSFNSQFNSVASRALGRYLSHHSRPEFTLWPFPLDTGKDAKSKLQRSEKLNDFFGAVAALGCKERDVAMEMSLVAEIRATSMHPRDYVRDRYTRKGIHRNQSRITEKYCNFITTTVVTAQDAADRERTMRSWVKVAYFCFKLRNFMTTVEILTALSVAPVRRLPDTHRVYELPRFKKMQKTMAYSSNYKCYRMYLREKTENRAFVPYFGLIFKDIYGIENSKPKMRSEGKDGQRTVLFHKAEKLERYLARVFRHRAHTYAEASRDSTFPGFSLRPNAKMRALLAEGLASSADLDTLFELSYKIHPRKGKRSPTNGNGRDPNA